MNTPGAIEYLFPSLPPFQLTPFFENFGTPIY